MKTGEAAAVTNQIRREKRDRRIGAKHASSAFLGACKRRLRCSDLAHTALDRP